MSTNKSKMVMNIFNSISNKYDIMNDFMSFGMHRLWKNKAVSMIDNIYLDSKIIDVACGTCDISMKIAQNSTVAEVFACDINSKMLTEGRDKLLNNNITNVNFTCCAAESLPFPDETFSNYIIVFGIRNVSDRNKTLSEAFRVLKNKGKFICMEFSPMNNETCSIFKKLYDFHSFVLIPNIGFLTTGNRDAYQYLVDSIRKFPEGELFKKEIIEAGFKNVTYHNIMNGVVKMHTAYKI